MSYAASLALQKAICAALKSDAELQTIVGSAIFDSAPAGDLPVLFVLLGAEKARDRSDQTGAGSLHEVGISVVSGASGFATAKAVAARVQDVLHRANLALERGRLVFLAFQKASARRSSDGGRRVDLTFRARVDDI